jgi:hypothetical protein
MRDDKEGGYVARFLESALGQNLALAEFKSWVDRQGFLEPVTYEPEDYAAARAEMPMPRTADECTELCQLAQAHFMVRKWREAHEALRGN